MSFYVNELSLHAQYPSASDFHEALRQIMVCRSRIEASGHVLWGSETLSRLPVSGEMSFGEAVRNLVNRDQRSAVYAWLNRNDWRNSRQHSDEEGFEWEGIDVCGTALAEASFRTWAGEESWLLSFEPSRCSSSPLRLKWLSLQDELTDIEVENFWTVLSVSNHLANLSQRQQLAPVTSWPQLIEWARSYCGSLVLADYVLDPLNGVPFSRPIAERTQRLLKVLNDLTASIGPNGGYSAAGHGLYQQYFMGERALFTDESTTNKLVFEKELTFKHPAASHDPLFCPYHGKISHGTFRIHFSWPPLSDEPLYVVYIGPKITRG